MTPEIRTSLGEALLGSVWSRVAPFWAHDVRGSLNTIAIHLELMQAMTSPETPEHQEIVKGAREIRAAIEAVTARLADMERLAAAARERPPERPADAFADHWAAVGSLAAIHARKRNRRLTITGEPPREAVFAAPGDASPVLGVLHLVLAAVETAVEGGALTVEARGDADAFALAFSWSESGSAGAGPGEDALAEFRDVAAAHGWRVPDETGAPDSRIEITFTKGKPG